MDSGVFGGGLLLVVLALLWVVVLIPAWSRNRQYRAAEKHTAHIQRTLRMIAETSELPEEHVVEATAKTALQHQKMLKQMRSQEAAAEKIEQEKLRAAGRLAEYELKREVAMQKAQLRSAKLSHPRLKPVRLVAALATVLGLVGILIGAGMAIGGLGPATLLVALASAGLGLTTLVVLAPGKAAKQTQQAPAPVQSAARPQQPLLDLEAEAPEPDTSHEEYLAQQARARAQRERARAMSQARKQVSQPSERVNQTNSILLREGDLKPRTAGAAAENLAADRPASATPSESPASAAAVPAAGAADSARAAGAAASGAGSTAEAQRDSRPMLDVEAKTKRLAAQERLRSMGVVGDTAQGAPNIADALRRRRNVS
ncbi:hypothetical protein JSO19_08995 [Leucobacter sp. UCMA 4100]|uniref:hypothetical protein n=1 Tax=Leucobacter sp. UCMA 4100 TaxID=2810534 RepID=UPI0022EA1ACD|nr:hypothetical protein [Leucobacter sp. UCMA 4100]MDA3147516.1 hypothetical protein [Leucobacter sp. UCMA 4100]